MRASFRAIVTLLVLAVGVGVTPAAAQEQAIAKPWSFSLGVSGSYEENALFVGPTDDQKEFVHNVNASLSRSWALRRGTAQATVGGSQPFYQKSGSLNDFSYSVNGGVSYAMTHRLTWSGSSNLSSGLAREDEVLNDAGQVLPSTTVRSTSSASSFSYALSRRSQLGWTLSQQGVSFASAFFAGGSSIGSSLNWNRQLTGSQTIGVTHSYQHAWATEDSQSIHTIAATWGKVIRVWTVTASIGASPYTVADEPGYRVSSIYSGSISRPLRRGHSLSAGYSKSVLYAFGAASENRPTHMASVTYALPLANKLSASFSGSYSRATVTSVEDGVRPWIGAFGNAALMYSVAPNLGISFGTSGFIRQDGSAPRVSSYRMTLGLTYGTSWR